MTELDAIEKRANAATKPPWEARPNEPDLGGLWHVYAMHSTGENSEADSVFTAHAREDIPALIARVRELENDVNELTVLDLRERVRELEEALSGMTECRDWFAGTGWKQARGEAEQAERQKWLDAIEEVREAWRIPDTGRFSKTLNELCRGVCDAILHKAEEGRAGATPEHSLPEGEGWKRGVQYILDR